MGTSMRGSRCSLCMLAACVLLASAVSAAQTAPTDLPLSSIVLPAGFSIALYTTDSVQNPRSLVVSPANNSGATVVYASSNGAGVITALVDLNSNGTADSSCVLLSNLSNPEGIVWIHGSLYVAEITTVTRYDNVDAAALNNCRGLAAGVVVAMPFANTATHNARHAEFGPDGKIYMSYGSAANIDLCPRTAPANLTRCAIVRMNPDGSQLEDYVTGVRNSVGFTWHPDTQQFYFIMIERDLMGDNRPDDLLYAHYPPETHYGYPYCHWQGAGDPFDRLPGPGTALADPDVHDVEQTEILQSNPADVNASLNAYCNETTLVPIQALGAHVSGLGLHFYTGSMFPSYYNRTLFIPEHGSWNRPLEIGYRVVNVKIDENNRAVDHTIFAQGWLQNQNTTAQSVWGRPVQTAQLPDGSLLLSDDSANAIYRITYSTPSSVTG